MFKWLREIFIGKDKVIVHPPPEMVSPPQTIEVKPEPIVIKPETIVAPKEPWEKFPTYQVSEPVKKTRTRASKPKDPSAKITTKPLRVKKNANI